MASRNVKPLYGWPRTSTRAYCGGHHGARVHCFVRRNCMAIPNLIPAGPSSLQCLDGQHLKVFVQSLGMLIEVSQDDVTNLSVRCFLWDAGPKASKTKRFNYSCTPASPKRILNVRVVGKVLAAGGQYEICGVCIGLCDRRSRRRQQRHENQRTTDVTHLQQAFDLTGAPEGIRTPDPQIRSKVDTHNRKR